MKENTAILDCEILNKNNNNQLDFGTAQGN